MGSYKFKSVGRTTADVEEQKIISSPLPIGIVTPLQEGGSDGVFRQHYSLRDLIRDNLRNLIQTNFGTRLIRYDYGANILPLVFDYTSTEDFEKEVSARISRAVGRWMPYVQLIEFGVSFLESQGVLNTGLTKLKVLIRYDVPSAGVKGDAIEVLMSCM